MSTDVLIVWGGWQGHEPEACATLFADLLRADGLSVTVADDLAVLADPEVTSQLKLAVPMWTMGEIPKDSLKALLELVRNGCGLGGWHGGMCDAFRKEIDYQFMCGGQWVQHPGGVIDYSVQITDLDHPITAGLDDFDLHSEQYYMHVDPSNQVLATTRFAGDQQGMDWIRNVVMPVAWTRRYGAGRVFYSSVGHVRADFDVPEARELVRRGLLWAANAPVTDALAKPVPS